jgi:hypothetical protein
MNIRAALFIGLRTSGVCMIQEFRRLMYEQFNLGGLPLFQYLGIETNNGFSVSDAHFPDEFSLQPYEKIDLVKACVANADSVRGCLDKRSPKYIPNLERWFDRSIHRAGFSINEGAGHIRV